MLKHIFNRLTAVLLFGAAIALTTSLGSCGGGDSSTSEGPDTATYTALSDTISDLMGCVNGYSALEQLQSYRELVDSTYSYTEFTEGLKLLLDRRHGRDYIEGVLFGLQMSAEVDSLNIKGYPIDRKYLCSEIAANIENGLIPVKKAEEEFPSISERLSKASPSEASKELCDSFVIVLAQLAADQIITTKAKTATKPDQSFNKALFVEGMQNAFLDLKTREYIAGAIAGSNVLASIEQTEKYGTNIRRERVLSKITGIISGKKIHSESKEKQEKRLRELIDSLSTQAYNREETRLAASDEAKINMAKGTRAVNELKKSDENYLTTPSGITYQIRKQGTGRNVELTDTVVVNIIGARLDYKVFNNETKTKISVSDLFPGAQESVMLLNKGAKGSFWIPGKLAFKGHGAKQYGIGPMETIILHIEVLDIK